MRRLSSTVLLAGAALALVSLYLPWEEPAAAPGQISGSFSNTSGPTAGLLNLFSGSLPSIDGWSTAVGPAAALFALLLATASAVALARPHLKARIPLGQCALLTSYFGLAVGAESRWVARETEARFQTDFHYNFTYGAYVGTAGAVVALFAARAGSKGILDRGRTTSRLAVLVPVSGLLVTLELPWYRDGGGFSFDGITDPAAMAAAAFALRFLVVSWNADRAAGGERLMLAVAAALLTGAAVSATSFPASHEYGAWIGLGFAVSLGGVALIQTGSALRPTRLSWPQLGTCGAVAILLVGLFLPWQKTCFAAVKDLGPVAGRCVATSGWTMTSGAAAGILAIAFVLSTLDPRRLAASAGELALGLGLLVSTLGLSLVEGRAGPLRFEFGYGSTIGFAAAALLVASTVARLRPPAIAWRRVPARLAPLVACTGYVAIVVLPWWEVVPRHSQFAPISWLTIAGVLLAVRLLFWWARRLTHVGATTERLVILPFALLALAAIDLVRLRDQGVGWGGGVVVGLCVLLAVLGRIEQQGGLQNVRVPEILRVDRL